MTKKIVINPIGKDIRIGPVNFNIKPLNENEYGIIDGKCSDPFNHTIQINPELNGMVALETLLHESIHAIEFMRGLKLSERTVGILSYQIALMLAHNDWLLDYAKQQINEEYNI